MAAPTLFKVTTVPEGGDYAGDVFAKFAIDMAMYHGSVVRGMNAMMVYGPTVQPAQQSAFLFFCTVWARQLKGHHEYEETAFFPALEQHLGEGFLSKNVDQHASFMPALTRFVATLEAMQTGAEPFDGTEIGRQVQAFGPALVEHLSEEIDTLNLNVLRENVPLVEAQRIYKLQEDHIKAHSGLTAEIPLVLCNLNRLQFASWPPLPGPILWFVRNVAYYWHGASWQFGTSDLYGNVKPRFLDQETA